MCWLLGTMQTKDIGPEFAPNKVYSAVGRGTEGFKVWYYNFLQYFIMVDAIQKHEKAHEQAQRKVDENTEVYALIIKQVNVNMTHVWTKGTKADDSTIPSRHNYQLLQKQDG